MDDYPGNSRRQRDDATPKAVPVKKIERVLNADGKPVQVIQRKRTVGQRFRATFGGADARSAGSTVVADVLVPALKNMVAEAARMGVEVLIFGEVRRNTTNNYRTPSARSYVSYDKPTSNTSWRTPAQQSPAQTRPATSGRHFTDIEFETRGEAEQVIDQMMELIKNYDSCSVSDLLEMVGSDDATHVDQKWGWTKLPGASASPARGGGFILNLPKPTPLD